MPIQQPNPTITGQYLCSDETERKAQDYITKLINKAVNPGRYLGNRLHEAGFNPDNIGTITPKKLIMHLMNTRQPKLYAESQTKLDGTDWNADETAILADISFNTTGTHAYNNGAHDSKQQDHANPIEVNLIYVSSTLLRNDHASQTADMLDVMNGTGGHQGTGTLNEEAYYKLIERRLLPGLRAQNAAAKLNNESLVLNIPGLGLGQFVTTNYRPTLQKALPVALRRFFETHRSELDQFHTITYDPYAAMPGNEDKFSGEIPLDNGAILLQARPFTTLDKTRQASQLEYPKDGTDYTKGNNGKKFRLVKIVAWDPFSLPGNDIWENIAPNGNGRATDDGVSFASTDTIEALLNIKQLEANNEVAPTITGFEYEPKHGIFYPTDDSQQHIGYSHLAATYSSNVQPEMINIVPMIMVAAPASEPEPIDDKDVDTIAYEDALGKLKTATTNIKDDKISPLLWQIITEIEGQMIIKSGGIPAQKPIPAEFTQKLTTVLTQTQGRLEGTVSEKDYNNFITSIQKQTTGMKIIAGLLLALSVALIAACFVLAPMTVGATAALGAGGVLSLAGSITFFSLSRQTQLSKKMTDFNDNYKTGPIDEALNEEPFVFV